MEAFDATQRFIGKVRRSLTLVSWGEALFASLAVLLLTILLGIGLAIALGPEKGPWAWLLVGLGVLGSGYLFYKRHLKTKALREDDTEVALFIERQHPELKSSLVSATQAHKALQDTSKTSAQLGFSPLLAERTAAIADLHLAHIKPASLVDRSGLKNWALTTALSSLVLVGAGFFMPRAFEMGWSNLMDGQERTTSETHLYDVLLSQLDLEITPPAYTHLKSRFLPRSAGDFEAISGALVTFSGTILQPAVEAVLVLESQPQARWPLELSPEGLVSGKLQVGKADRYQFMLLSPEGEILREKAWREVRVREDGPPQVSLLLPENDMEVKPDATLDFFYEASDDFGLDRVDIVATDEAGTEIHRQTVSSVKGAPMDKGSTILDVARLKLEPGDSADVFFEAYDLNTSTGPGVGRSQARKLSLYSPQEEHDKLLLELRALMEKLLDTLAERLESPVLTAKRLQLEASADHHVAILHQMSLSIEDLDRLISGFSTDPLATEELRSGLRHVRDSFEVVQAQETKVLESWMSERDISEPDVFLVMLQRTNDEGTVALENGILRIKKLIESALKEAILEAGRELLATQNEMMELLKELKNTNDPAAREAALKKLRKLQEKLKELQQKLARLQERSPYENQNPAQRPSERQQETQNLDSQMDEIAKLLEEGKIDEAIQRMEELSRSTQEMMAGLEEDLEGLGQPHQDNPLQKEMQQLQQELNQLMDTQRELQKETRELQAELDQQQQQQLREQAQELLAELQADAEALKKKLAEVPESPLHEADQEALKALQKASEGLKDTIEQLKLNEAKAKAEDMAKNAQELGGEIGESEQREVEQERLKGLRQAMGELDQAGQQAQKLAEKLSQLEQNSKPQPNEGQQQRMQQLEQNQGKLNERMKQFQQKSQQLGEQMPGFNESMGEPLNKAGKAMGEAQDQLGKRQSQQAQQSQQEALENLQKAQQQLQQQQQQGSKQSNGNEDSSTGPNDPNSKVEIPKDNPNARTKELREEILRVMPEKAPEQYQDAIKKFYEELTK